MRFKVIAGNFVILVAVGLGAYSLARHQLSEALTAEASRAFVRKQRLFEQIWEGQAYELELLTLKQSKSLDVKRALRPLDESTRRLAAHRAAEDVAAWFRNPANAGRGVPDLVVLTNAEGQVLARDKDPNRWFGRHLAQEIKGLGDALSTSLPQHDIWHLEEENKLLEIAVAPVRDEAGSLSGALVVGFDLSGSQASVYARGLLADVAFFTERGIYSSSLGNLMAKRLAEGLKGSLVDSSRVLTGNGKVSAKFRDGGEKYHLLVERLPLTSTTSVGYALVHPARLDGNLLRALDVVLFAFGIGALLMLVYGLWVGSRIVRQIETLEEGMLAAINGNLQQRLSTDDADFGGLAYRVNQLLNLLGGIEETSSGDEGTLAPSDFTGQQLNASALGGGEGRDADAGAHEALPRTPKELFSLEEDAYLTRLYGDYRAAKRRSGENVESITESTFRDRIMLSAAGLSKERGRVVRFLVQEEAGSVRLDPVEKP